MSKGNKQRGNREAKKPKQEKPKAVATAGFLNASKSRALGPKKPSSRSRAAGSPGRDPLEFGSSG